MPQEYRPIGIFVPLPYARFLQELCETALRAEPPAGPYLSELEVIAAGLKLAVGLAEAGVITASAAAAEA